MMPAHFLGWAPKSALMQIMLDLQGCNSAAQFLQSAFIQPPAQLVLAVEYQGELLQQILINTPLWAEIARMIEILRAAKAATGCLP